MLYEYECCGVRFEQLRSIAERDEAICPKCGKKAKRLFSTMATFIMQFKPDWAYAWKQGKRF